MSLRVYPARVSVDATALVTFEGPPNVAVSWSVSGGGSITGRSAATDANGIATAVYIPASIGDRPVISVSHGTP